MITASQRELRRKFAYWTESLGCGSTRLHETVMKSGLADLPRAIFIRHMGLKDYLGQTPLHLLARGGGEGIWDKIESFVGGWGSRAAAEAGYIWVTEKDSDGVTPMDYDQMLRPPACMREHPSLYLAKFGHPLPGTPEASAPISWGSDYDGM